MKRKRMLLIAFTLLLVLAGCSDNRLTGTDGQGGRDTLYTEAKAMSIHLQNPDRALILIDSAIAVGNINKFRGQYLKAITQYGGYHNYALARQTCLDMVKKHPQTNQDSATLENAYTLLVSIEYMSNNDAALVRYATEASRLAHALDLPDEVGKMEGYIAYVMEREGNTDESIGRLKTILDELWQLKTFNGMLAYYNTTGNLQHILLDHKRYSEMVALCESTLEHIDEFARHIDHFADTPKGFDPKEFEDFARGQTLAFMTTAYARWYTSIKNGEVTPTVRAQLIQKARQAEAEMFKTKWSKTIDCDRMMTAAYHHLGEFQRFDEAMKRLDAEIGDDTINISHLIRLGLCATAAQMRGRLSEAIDYLNRKLVIQDSLECRNQRNQLNELATVYHLQEEQFARQQAENDARFMKLCVLFIGIALLAAIAFAAYFFYKRRETAKKNHVLAREIAEAINYKEKWESLQAQPQPLGKEVAASPEDSADKAIDASPSQRVAGEGSAGADAELFMQLRDVIIREQLYLDPRLDRQSLVDRFGLSKDRIGAAFAKGSPFKSLIDFLTDCRLPYAAKLLTEHPELSVADIARASGFPSADTFGRNFKQKYALTPSQFRDQQELV